VVLRRSLFLLSLLAAASGAMVVACAADGELNPQPLPPIQGDDDDSPKSPVVGGGSSGTSGSTSGDYGTSSSSSSGSPASPTDAGVTYDASDADASDTP